MTKLNQRGALGMIFIVLLVALLAFGGFFVWRRIANGQSSNAADEQPIALQEGSKQAQIDDFNNLAEFNTLAEYSISLPSTYELFTSNEIVAVYTEAEKSAKDSFSQFRITYYELPFGINRPDLNIGIETVINNTAEKINARYEANGEETKAFTKNLNGNDTVASIIISEPIETRDSLRVAKYLLFSADGAAVIEFTSSTEAEYSDQVFEKLEPILESVRFK